MAVISPERVLIVEDDLISAHTLVNLLSHLGYKVLGPVASGEDALTLSQGQRPDLALMDIQLAGVLDGVETARRLHAEFDVPVIYVTSHSDETLVARVRQTEASAFLTKPVEPAQLRAAIPLALSNHRIRRELRESEARYRELWLRSQRLEALGQLSAGIAHDFNNILTVVLGHAALVLRQEPLSGPQSMSLHQIRLAARRASELTRHLLAFTRRERTELAPVDLNRVVTGFARMIQRLLGETILFEFKAAVTLPAVMADTSMLEQVLMNLSLNARDAMPAGGRLAITTGEVTLREADLAQHPWARPNAVAGSFVTLSVADNGCGIDAVTLGRLFEPFFTTKGRGQGTGLGLATVLDIVKLHNGWVEVCSQPGQGASFTIFLPPSAQRPQDLADDHEAPLPRGRGETVFLVEDAEDVRELLRSFLEATGYSVYAAESGVWALRLWEEIRSEVDLLLTDIVLPGGISGVEVAARFLAARPSLKVIYTTAYDVHEVSPSGLLAEGVNFLAKPFRLEQLAVVMRRALDG